MYDVDMSTIYNLTNASLRQELQAAILELDTLAGIIERQREEIKSLRSGAVVARQAHNLEVAGANPASATKRCTFNIGKVVKMMTKVVVKISGTKATVKRPAPQSPANVRPVDGMKGTQNRQHTHVPVPKSLRNGKP